MNRLAVFLFGCLLFAGCTSSGEYVKTTTVSSQDQVATKVSEMMTATVQAIPKATRTPWPTKTATPLPGFDKEEKTLDKLINGWDGLYSFPIVQVTSVELDRKAASYYSVKHGYTFLRIEMIMKNQGEEVAELGSNSFIAVDDNGILYDPATLDTSCQINHVVNVLPGGSIKGCIYFEIPIQKHYLLYYAPYDMGRMDADRSLKWEISGLQ